MTPERKAWWDNLPQEEKEIRTIIRIKEYRLHSLKQEMTDVTLKCEREFWPLSSVTKEIFASYKREIRKCNLIIKILRKQIAMHPVVFKYPGYNSYECPECREGAITYLPHCSMCGQKLRWQ